MRLIFIKIVVGVMLFLLAVILLHCFVYLYYEFVVPSHVYINEQKEPDKYIPKHIHQVFGLKNGSTVVPDHFLHAQSTCLELNLSYNYTLWTSPMLENFIRKYYPDKWDLYTSYGYWVSRADMARYLIIHHYGGWYMDMDTQCHRSLDDIRQRAMSSGKTFIVRPTDPTGISNDFLGASARHPFMEDVLAALPHTNRWYIFSYPTIVFSTGPMFLWGRYINYGDAEQFYMVEDFKTYFESLHASTWHNWDGKVVVYFYAHPVLACSILIVICISIKLLLEKFIYLRKYIYNNDVPDDV